MSIKLYTCFSNILRYMFSLNTKVFIGVSLSLTQYDLLQHNIYNVFILRTVETQHLTQQQESSKPSAASETEDLLTCFDISTRFQLDMSTDKSLTMKYEATSVIKVWKFFISFNCMFLYW